MAGSRFLSLAVALALSGGCAGEPEPDEVALSGAVYTDFHTDGPCDPAAAPRELSGVELVFSDADGTVVVTARTGAIEAQELEFGPGKQGWKYPGCRYYAPYSTTLPVAASYRVAFEVAEPDTGPGGGYFEGVHLLEPSEISHDELAARDFFWTFEAPPAFVVP